MMNTVEFSKTWESKINLEIDNLEVKSRSGNRWHVLYLVYDLIHKNKETNEITKKFLIAREIKSFPNLPIETVQSYEDKMNKYVKIAERLEKEYLCNIEISKQDRWFRDSIRLKTYDKDQETLTTQSINPIFQNKKCPSLFIDKRSVDYRCSIIYEYNGQKRKREILRHKLDLGERLEGFQERWTSLAIQSEKQDITAQKIKKRGTDQKVKDTYLELISTHKITG